ncbi:MAG: PKD domain-containing protein [Janthinobacterium lividum]
MKTTYLALGLLALASCQKDPRPSSPAPTAAFAFAGSSADELTVPTYTDVQLVDHSARAASYRYTLGNDSLSTSAAPRVHYTKPGTYTITLTVQSADKQTATATRRVRVLERVAKQVVIQNLNDEANSPQHNLVNGTYWVVVRLGENNVQYPQPPSGNLSFEAPILYQSPKVMLTQASLPYSFELPTPLVINYPALRSITLPTVRNSLGYKGVGYGFEIYEQDANGNTYLLTSSYVPYYRSSSGGITDYGTDFQQNIMRTGYGGIYLKGDFE